MNYFRSQGSFWFKLALVLIFMGAMILVYPEAVVSNGVRGGAQPWEGGAMVLVGVFILAISFARYWFTRPEINQVSVRQPETVFSYFRTFWITLPLIVGAILLFIFGRPTTPIQNFMMFVAFYTTFAVFPIWFIRLLKRYVGWRQENTARHAVEWGQALLYHPVTEKKIFLSYPYF